MLKDELKIRPDHPNYTAMLQIVEVTSMSSVERFLSRSIPLLPLVLRKAQLVKVTLD